MLKKLLLALVIISLNLAASDIEVKNAYVRAVPPNLRNSASFMTIVNRSNKDLFLIYANSSVAKNAELHEHIKLKNGMMRMQQVKSIKIPANHSFALKPGGYHVMLFELNKKLKVGESVKSITLSFSNKETIVLKNVPIKSVIGGMKMK